MRTALLLLVSICRTTVHSRASLSISPSSSQHVEYDGVTLSCDQLSAGEWTVWRIADGLSRCGSGWGERTSSSSCVIASLKASDGGTYWCQSEHGDSSNTVSISVISGGSVVLQSPALPVTAGHDVTLTCVKRTSPNLPADFYKNDSFIGRGPKGHVTVRHFSKSDEGVYKCTVGAEESPPSRMLLEDSGEPPSLTLSPDFSHHLEYDNLTLSCTPGGGRSPGWTILRSAASSGGHVSRCGDDWGNLSSSHCVLETAKQTDSATYWCESPAGQRSNSLNITVHDTAVVLQSALLPVTAGDDVTLTCRSKSSSHLPAHFYKDGSFIGAEPTGHMTIHHVSTSDEGVYRCDIRGEESPPSWLFVRAAPSSPDSALFTVIRHLVVFCPYCVSTALMVSIIHGNRSSGRKRAVSMTTSPTSEDEEGAYDDVTTEHHF